MNIIYTESIEPKHHFNETEYNPEPKPTTKKSNLPPIIYSLDLIKNPDNKLEWTD